MTLDIKEISSRLEKIKQDFQDDISGNKGTNLAETIRIKYLGRKGQLSSLFALLGKVAAADRPVLGKQFNVLKQLFQQEIDKLAELESEQPQRIDFFDRSLPGVTKETGTFHPLYQVLEEIKGIFVSLGFTIESGPELETDYYNFEALNIPKDHPSRDLQDTFYIDDDLVLRTHTSPVQIRTMEKLKPPIRMIAPGKCYRKDAIDATHFPLFHQVEGLC
ncbi:MAG: phenylalanine--tRNA ligase subunit alpha, partial [bacterium]|nr:phenylalanine--tRNA ligase subunit alpha [bacterium]